ncbi:MAG: TraB/GumN family protein [Akkermansiaceae bacterium]
MIRALVILVVLAPFFAFAEKAPAVGAESLKHPVKAALWKVEGKGLEKPSYLFGTIHLSDPRVVKLHPNAEAAFEASSHFYAEIDLDPAAQVKLVPKMMRTDGKPLSESIGPDLTKALDAQLKAISPQMSSASFQSMKTWAIYATLPVLELQMKYAGKPALDTVLYNRAKSENKTVGALETAESQLKIFDSLKEEEQVKLLASTIEAMKKDKAEGKDSIKELLDAYLTKDVPTIGAIIKKFMEEDQPEDAELAERLINALLDDRNIKMADTIEKQLTQSPKGVHFFAVGAAHYTGKTAVQDLLIKKGYTITSAF